MQETEFSPAHYSGSVGDWQEYEIRVERDALTVNVNGMTVSSAARLETSSQVTLHFRQGGVKELSLETFAPSGFHRRVIPSDRVPIVPPSQALRCHAQSGQQSPSTPESHTMRGFRESSILSWSSSQRVRLGISAS